jgi:hypothetical protein
VGRIPISIYSHGTKAVGVSHGPHSGLRNPISTHLQILRARDHTTFSGPGSAAEDGGASKAKSGLSRPHSCNKLPRRAVAQTAVGALLAVLLPPGRDLPTRIEQVLKTSSLQNTSRSRPWRLSTSACCVAAGLDRNEPGVGAGSLVSRSHSVSASCGVGSARPGRPVHLRHSLAVHIF